MFNGIPLKYEVPQELKKNVLNFQFESHKTQSKKVQGVAFCKLELPIIEETESAVIEEPNKQSTKDDPENP